MFKDEDATTTSSAAAAVPTPANMSLRAISDPFIHSLSECSKWVPSGGKSGLSFYKTKNERFILKEVSKFEYQSFKSCAKPYFHYMTNALGGGKDDGVLPTLLAKILGVYRIAFKNSVTGKSLKVDVLVMENLFYQRKIKESYDLKGSVRNRMVDVNSATAARVGGKSAATSGVLVGGTALVAPPARSTATPAATTESNKLVLMDENLLKISCERPLYISHYSKQVRPKSSNHPIKQLNKMFFTWMANRNYDSFMAVLVKELRLC